MFTTKRKNESYLPSYSGTNKRSLNLSITLNVQNLIFENYLDQALDYVLDFTTHLNMLWYNDEFVEINSSIMLLSFLRIIIIK